MEEKIIYKGETRALSDLDCPDGDLSLSLNVINENNALRPIILPDILFSMAAGETLLYIHSTADYKNYIYKTENSLKAFSFNNGIRNDFDFSESLYGDTIRQIQSIGNTLILLTDRRMSYILFKENNYNLLGEKPPFASISFGLIGKFIRTDEFDVPLHTYWYQAFDQDLRDDYKKIVTDAIIPKVNKFIKEESKDKGKFIYPFFVRYAYRLFDGSLFTHSAPILMLPSTTMSPIAFVTGYVNDTDGTDEYKDFKCRVCAQICTLNYQLNNNIIGELEHWKDVIKSVDIFISAPIYTYDQSGEIKRIDHVYTENDTNFSICKHEQGNGLPTINYNVYTKYPFTQTYALWNPESNGMYYTLRYMLPQITGEKLHELITEERLFYKISSIDTANLNYNERTEIKLKENVLNTLQVQEVMTDDYNSHDEILPTYLYTYNSRLNMANLKKTLYNGFPMDSMTGYSESDKYYSDAIAPGYSFSAYVFIKEGDRDIIVNAGSFKQLGTNLYYLFYPNPNAYKMVIFRSIYFPMGYAELLLTTHKGLNGSYYFGGFNDLNWIDSYDISITNNKTINLPNKIYTSEVNNPFHFPLSGINTVGVGQILGISSTTRALSQGQFGQFPLLVFSTDGIWAMEVSETGLYSTKQPISRDVCSNPQSITQTDGAIVFISDKGAIMINGSEVISLSGALSGPSFNLDSVKKLDEIAIKEGLVSELNSIMPIKEFFAGCQIAFDYPNSRLYFIYPDKPYSMVYSLASSSWAKVSSGFVQTINDYPDCYIQDQNGGILNISEKINYDSEKVSNGLMLSRPIKLGDNELKTVTEVINRGIFEKNDISMLLFASVDGITYFPIGSAIGPKLYRISGTPYRYFRIGLIAKLNLQKSISGTSVYFDKRARNRPR
jgi:hypothetical protein